MRKKNSGHQECSLAQRYCLSPVMPVLPVRWPSNCRHVFSQISKLASDFCHMPLLRSIGADKDAIEAPVAGHSFSDTDQRYAMQWLAISCARSRAATSAVGNVIIINSARGVGSSPCSCQSPARVISLQFSRIGLDARTGGKEISFIIA